MVRETVDVSVDPSSPIPIYYQVYTSLLDRIQAGEFAVGAPLPAERRLAVEYEVSRITVSKALELLESDDLISREQGRGTFVRDTDRREEKPALAMAFVTGVTLHPYIYSILMGAARVAAEAHIQFHLVGIQDDSGGAVAARIAEDNAAGAMIYPRPDHRDLALTEALCANGVPLVMVDRYYEQVDCDCVLFDDGVASYDLTQRLIERGHRRIAVLTHHEVFVSSIHSRIAGYRTAMQEHGIDDEDLVWLDVYSRLKTSQGQVGNRNMTLRLLERMEQVRPTALLALNHDVAERLNYDLMHINAERAQRALSGSGVLKAVEPEIAAFAYRNLGGLSPWNVLTALQPGEILGEKAAELIAERAEGRRSGDPVTIRVSPKIVGPGD
jgi:DNA-binding LacI/PurR family transcriptional regulator